MLSIFWVGRSVEFCVIRLRSSTSVFEKVVRKQKKTVFVLIKYQRDIYINCRSCRIENTLAMTCKKKNKKRKCHPVLKPYSRLYPMLLARIHMYPDLVSYFNTLIVRQFSHLRERYDCVSEQTKQAEVGFEYRYRLFHLH